MSKSFFKLDKDINEKRLIITKMLKDNILKDQHLQISGLNEKYKTKHGTEIVRQNGKY